MDKRETGWTHITGWTITGVTSYAISSHMVNNRLAHDCEKSIVSSIEKHNREDMLCCTHTHRKKEAFVYVMIAVSFLQHAIDYNSRRVLFYFCTDR